MARPPETRSQPRRRVEPAEPAERQKRWTTLIAALGGVVVAGVLSTGGTWLLQSQQDRRLDQQTEERAVGTARLLFTELSGAQSAVLVFGEDGIVRPFDETMRIDVAADDLKLVASRVSAERWAAISQALTNLTGLENMVGSLVAQKRTRLNTGQRCLVRMDLYSLAAAADAIRPLARAPGEPADADVPECNPGVGRVLVQVP